MHLFHFTTAEHGLQAIRDHRLKLAHIDKLNDPFEFIFTDLADQDSRQKAKSFRDFCASKLGFISFSERWNNPLMWGHYARNHSGICLKFKITTDAKVKVSYTPERLIYPADELRKLNENNSETQFKEILSRKSDLWSYENEWRLYFKLNELSFENGLHYASFQDLGELTSVIIGLSSQLTIPEICRELSNDARKVPVFRTTISPDKYEMIQGDHSVLA
jgi:hypothetical protein